ncbi:hypothetical protein BDN71DRAFT_1440288 [Pleurotus eryngii]|uniref:Uncharacterized protein n=1 Tax=Pleurotus eryngii TaxID=5323 RepID=A0A9P6A712_PLEER|nr:hypothetical protein BDN71DRAFT_1440288 [Pleurotus eryngii]
MEFSLMTSVSSRKLGVIGIRMVLIRVDAVSAYPGCVGRDDFNTIVCANFPWCYDTYF